MANLHRNVEAYTAFGRLLDELCLRKGISFNRLASQAGMKSHASIIRACQGKSTPTRAHLLSWCEILECSPEQRAQLLHIFQYATPEEVGDLEKAVHR